MVPVGASVLGLGASVGRGRGGGRGLPLECTYFSLSRYLHLILDDLEFR